MTDRPSPAAAVRASAAYNAVLHVDTPADLATINSAEIAAVAVAAAPATQVRRPWRATVRTAVQGLAGLLAVLPLLVEASGLDETTPLLGGALVVSAGVTRVMALPAVEDWLERFVPWLAATPASPTT